MENTEQQEYVPTIFMGKEDVNSIKEVLEKDKEHIIEAVRNGEINPLDVIIKARTYEKTIKEISEAVNEFAISEAEKYSYKTFGYKGFKITRSETRKYDLSGIGEYDDVVKQIDDRKKLLKSITEKYKTASIENPIIDTKTGEEITSVPYLTTVSIKIQ